MRYLPQKIERKWQKVWAKENYKIWHVPDLPHKKHIYILDMFPYPSGKGLHVGHVEGYAASDIISRYYRMKGYQVLHPMGWDAFGLPAENYALKTKKPPQEVVKQNIKHFKEQLRSLGFSYDWQREINTTEPFYYKWTQWIFLQLFKKGLAYESDIAVNWCPSCKTVLANEEVIDGKCSRCGTLVERKKLKQWVLRITSYADKLLRDLKLLDWPSRVKTMQTNWIGRSVGYDVRFKVVGEDDSLTVFTTRIDTIFGVTYLVLAPEHPLVKKIIAITDSPEVKKYVKEVSRKSDFERQSEIKNKTGVFLGTYAINPATREKIPIWVSDYVISSYGTGAVMGVPAHDQRDFEFAQAFHLPIKQVISSDGKEEDGLDKAYEKEGILINSGPFDGRQSKKIQDKIALYVGGKKIVRYKLRDWIFSRQRYWGEPIPIVHCPHCGEVPVSERKLPLRLPKIKKYEPTGRNESPLADISDWVNTKCPKCGRPATREANTMPQWAGSSWYYLAYLLGSKGLKNKTFDFGNKHFKKIFAAWLPVDIYVGGVEHAVLHLLYSRFWHKVLYDLGVVSTSEPFHKLVNQGIILGEDGEKMSKSRGNIANPDDIIKKYGADSLRIYEMFMGPLSFSKPWSSQGVVGIYRFLNRVWSLVVNTISTKKERSSSSVKMTKEAQRKLKSDLKELESLRHQTIKKVTEDIEKMHFNTAISSLMQYSNALIQTPSEYISAIHLETLVKLLFPFAPHMAQELWTEYLKHKSLLDKEKWPSYQDKFLQRAEFVLIVQVNGKTKGTIKVANNASEANIRHLASNLARVKKSIKGKKIKKVIFIPQRLINFVI